MNDTSRRSKKPQRETVSAAIPTWKKRLVESVRDQRGDRFTSGTLEYALDLLLEQYGLLRDRAA